MRTEDYLREDHIYELLIYFASFTQCVWQVHLSGNPRNFEVQHINTPETEECKAQLANRDIPFLLQIGVEYNLIGIDLDIAIKHYEGVNPNEKAAIRSGIL